MKFSKQSVAIACALIALAVASTWYLTKPSAQTLTPAEPPPSPTIQSGSEILSYPAGAAQLTMLRSEALPPTAAPIADTLSARIAYDEDVTARIGIAVSGRILSIKVAPGDAVKKGAVLAEVDSPDVGAALADLGKARADEQHKRLTMERAKDLGTDDGIAAKDVEAAQADYAAAHAETIRAEQRLKNINPGGLVLDGQRVAVTSPLAGVVTERTATPALEVGPGMGAPLFVTPDLRRLWLMIDLPEKLLQQVKLGAAVDVESDAYPGERFRAKIVQLGQVVDPNTRRVVVRAKLDNPASKLLPEMFVRASVLQQGASAVRVPNSAVVNRGIYSYVFVETAPGQFQRRMVKLVLRGADASFVGGGLQGGERVVVTGALLLDAELSAPVGEKS